MTSASLAWFAIVGAQKGVQVGLPTIAVLALAVVSATAGRYVIDITSGVPPKMFGRGEWYAGTALLAGIVWVACDTISPHDWINACIAFAVAYTVRVLAMLRGLETHAQAATGGAPAGRRPTRLGPKLTGRSEQELRDLGLLAEDGPDQDET